jgi:hypothetical protein
VRLAHKKFKVFNRVFSVIADLLSIEERLENLERRVQKLEDTISASGPVAASKPDSIESLIISNVNKIETQDLVIIGLKLKPRQTKTQIKAMLQDWGARVGNWFQGGNLGTRMVRKSIVKKEETKEGVVFSLTKKGELLAQKALDEIKSGAYWQ